MNRSERVAIIGLVLTGLGTVAGWLALMPPGSLGSAFSYFFTSSSKPPSSLYSPNPSPNPGPSPADVIAKWVDMKATGATTSETEVRIAMTAQLRASTPLTSVVLSLPVDAYFVDQTGLRFNLRPYISRTLDAVNNWTVKRGEIFRFDMVYRLDDDGTNLAAQKRRPLQVTGLRLYLHSTLKPIVLSVRKPQTAE
jgi:hypothetical protein